VLAEIIAAAADYEQPNRTHLMPRQQRQFGHPGAQNRGICSQAPCRGRQGPGWVHLHQESSCLKGKRRGTFFSGNYLNERKP
jgi:hypothetical protein